MNDPTSIKLAGTWIQDFVNNATKTFTVTEVLPNGHRTTTVKKTIFNPYEVPFLLLGTKFDQVCITSEDTYLLSINEYCGNS